MLEEDLELAIKVVIVGNGAVGKSSMIQRYCKGIFTRDYKKTIGVDFLERQLDMDGEEIRLMLWDTAGQEEFDAITKAYYKGAQACVLAYSTVDRQSYDAVRRWKQKVEDEVGPIAMVLVQNKIDLAGEALVKVEEGEALAQQLNLKFYETSVKENYNIDCVFTHLTNMCLYGRTPTDTERDRTDVEYDTNTYMSSGIPAVTDCSPKHSVGTIQLHPSKKRTGGKKTVVVNCVLA